MNLDFPTSSQRSTTRTVSSFPDSSRVRRAPGHMPCTPSWRAVSLPNLAGATSKISEFLGWGLHSVTITQPSINRTLTEILSCARRVEPRFKSRKIQEGWAETISDPACALHSDGRRSVGSRTRHGSIRAQPVPFWPRCTRQKHSKGIGRGPSQEKNHATALPRYLPSPNRAAQREMSAGEVGGSGSEIWLRARRENADRTT